jgi:hypothetical protein
MDTLPNSHKMSPFDAAQSADTAVFHGEEHAEYEGGEGEYDQNGQYEQDAQHYEQDPNGHYAQDGQGHYPQDGHGHYPQDGQYPQDQGHYDQEYEQQAALPGDFPVAPPAAVVANNSRFYEGEGEYDMSQITSPASASSSAAIPSYSAMNKYAAFSPGSATPPTNVAPSPSTNQADNAGYDGVAVGYDPYATGGPLNSRPGGGYRAYDSADAGGYA